jgi:hypothetical protein
MHLADQGKHVNPWLGIPSIGCAVAGVAAFFCWVAWALDSGAADRFFESRRRFRVARHSPQFVTLTRQYQAKAEPGTIDLEPVQVRELPAA